MTREDIDGITDALSEAYALGLEEPENPVSQGIRLAVRMVAVKLGKLAQTPDDKSAFLGWLLDHGGIEITDRKRSNP